MGLPQAYCLGRCGQASASDPTLQSASFQVTLTRDIPAPSSRGAGDVRTLALYVGFVGQYGASISVADDAGNDWSVVNGTTVGTLGILGGPNSGTYGGAIAIAYVGHALRAGQKITVSFAPTSFGGWGIFGFAAADCLEFVQIPPFAWGTVGNGGGAVNVVGTFAKGSSAGPLHGSGDSLYTLDVSMWPAAPNVLLGMVVSVNYDGHPPWDVGDFATHPGTGSDPGTPPWQALGAATGTPLESEGSETELACSWVPTPGDPAAFWQGVGGVGTVETVYPSSFELNPLFRLFDDPPQLTGYNLLATSYASDPPTYTGNPGGALSILTAGFSLKATFILRVFDPCTALPVQGLRVDLLFGGVKTSRYTDSNGLVVFPNLDSGLYTYSYGVDYDDPAHRPPGTIGTNVGAFIIVAREVIERSEELNRPAGCPGGVGVGIDCAETAGVGTGSDCLSTAGVGTGQPD